jgi:phosphatidate cytidylyltransferase
MSNRFAAANLVPRVASALVAVAIIGLVGWRFEAFGLQILVGVIIALMLREYIRMSFTPLKAPVGLTVWFVAAATTLLLSLFNSEDRVIVLAVCFSLYISVSLWFARNKMENAQLLSLLSRGIVGLIVCIVFPYFEIQLLRLPNGISWFALHLLMVFGGDVFAYFVGIGFGSAKLMPEVSPKKTVAGAFGGLGGSIVISVFFALWFLPHIPVWQITVVAVVCGFTAQMGDLFLSLIKRVANIKDSGHLMPGHGGILDRVDGVLMTCPLIFAFALLSEYWMVR